ncbi:MAG: hypothetical protein GWN99_01950 [Gemmatimonadetes bacterium]|uniref:Glucose/arabinose dehydrogenase n=1 Tax=Candidatus Kutchimonas denitrificans TaxID=3056748 RepID=A0AAE5CB77_9BACT|nr:hypothetical protein [Gemmatimonadota bacterium]NIR74208.1 hypothetical protein [Candidatus Kutchimonas denitrificans]NIR99830.1 hypothetical protein [Gemmatimonadota bacterium]NIT65419.1 hypothetical protein [Gemmatimonadota bacterium]NIU51784.1 hypothetical protein [Gemmatimonadota bacterium]
MSLRSPSIAFAFGSTLAAALWPGVGWGQRPGPILEVPPGFTVDLIAGDLPSPVALTFGPDGRLYVALRDAGRVVALEDIDGDRAIDRVVTAVDGLARPSDLAFRNGELWVLDSARVVRVRGPFGDGTGGREEIALDSLLAGGPPAASFAFFAGGVLVAIGAECETCPAGNLGSGIVVNLVAEDGEPRHWSRGLRRVAAMAVQPSTGVLWATETGPARWGSDLPADELNTIRAGRHYGWPYCYGNRIPTPEFADPARCDRTEPPVLTLPAGSAPTGIVFYGEDAFPSGYRGDAFIALAGSVAGPTFAEPRVARIRFVDGRPVALENFVTGWVGEAGRLGRPSHLAVGPGGALYVSDDLAGRVWRVSWVSGDIGEDEGG